MAHLANGHTNTGRRDGYRFAPSMLWLFPGTSLLRTARYRPAPAALSSRIFLGSRRTHGGHVDILRLNWLHVTSRSTSGDWKMSADSSHLSTMDGSGTPPHRLDTGPKILAVITVDSSDSSPSPVVVTQVQKLLRDYSELRALDQASAETRKEILGMARSRQRNEQWVQAAGAFLPFCVTAAHFGTLMGMAFLAWNLAQTGHDWLAGVALGSGGVAAAAVAFLQRLKG
jgi:hypothetical protein